MFAPLPDLRLRRRAAQLVLSMVRGLSPNSIGGLGPADFTQESFTRGAYRFSDSEGVTRTALHAPMQSALRELVAPMETATVAHAISVLNYSGQNGKEDLLPVGNDRTWGYELFQSLVFKDEVPIGPAVTELRSSHGILSSQSDAEIPFADHPEHAVRAMDSVNRLLPGRYLIYLVDREFAQMKLLRHLAESCYVIRYANLSRIVAVHGMRVSISRHLVSLQSQHTGEVIRRFAHSTQTYSLWVGESDVTMPNPSLRGV